jgi:GWxTD domain-containing protein
MSKTVSGIAAALALLAAMACHGLPGPKGLDDESAEFYSKVRYIITKEERETFLRISPADRPAFIKEFWERRDPKPGTEINEFKEEYFARIEDANRLFRQGSTPGWLQDRGRTYITLGPPDNRETYPRGIDFYGKPQEIWWYGFFPVVFIDDNWTGNYQLTPLGAQHISEIHRAQTAERARGSGKSYEGEGAASVDYEISVEKVEGRPVFVIRVPYKAIWFKAEGEGFKTTLEVALSVKNSEGEAVWGEKKSFDITASRSEGLKLFEETYEMRIEADVPSGRYTLDVEVSNLTGGGKSKRSLDIEV